MLLEKFLSSLAYVNLDQALSADLIKKLVSELEGEFIASEYIIWISYILRIDNEIRDTDFLFVFFCEIGMTIGSLRPVHIFHWKSYLIYLTMSLQNRNK